MEEQNKLLQEIIEFIEKVKKQNKDAYNFYYYQSFESFLNLLEDTKPSELLNEIDNYILRKNEIATSKEIKELLNELLTKIENFTSTQPKPQLEKYNKPRLKRVILLNDRTSANIFNESEETKFKLRKLEVSYKVIKRQDYKLSLEDRLIYSCVMTFKLMGYLYFSIEDLYCLINTEKQSYQFELDHIKERLNLMRNTFVFLKTQGEQEDDEKEFKGKLLNLEEYEYFNKQKKKTETIYFIKDIFFFNLLLFLKQKNQLIYFDQDLLAIKQPSKMLRELNYYLILIIHNIKGSNWEKVFSSQILFNKIGIDIEERIKAEKEEEEKKGISNPWKKFADINEILEKFKNFGLISSAYFSEYIIQIIPKEKELCYYTLYEPFPFEYCLE